MPNSLDADRPNDREATCRRLREGGPRALGEILETHRARLRRSVLARLDWRVRARIDPCDVIQEAYLEASQRVEEYLSRPKTSFFLWLRYLTLQKLVQLHRFHLGAQVRDAARDVSLFQGPPANSVGLAAQLVGDHTGPSEAAMRAELSRRLMAALDAMKPEDREIVALRHFERLSSEETAQILGIAERAASKRYLRALKRLREAMADTDRPERSEP